MADQDGGAKCGAAGSGIIVEEAKEGSIDLGSNADRAAQREIAEALSSAADAELVAEGKHLGGNSGTADIGSIGEEAKEISIDLGSNADDAAQGKIMDALQSATNEELIAELDKRMRLKRRFADAEFAAAEAFAPKAAAILGGGD